MGTIIHKNAIYKESIKKPIQKHKKCPEGQHWNYEWNKCMDIPEGLKNSINTAHGESKKANKHVGKSRGGRMEHASDLHTHAQYSHTGARDHAQRLGFHDLSKHHGKIAKKHNTMAHKLMYGAQKVRW